MAISFPRYLIVGQRPVKALLDDEGNVGIYAYNWDTGEFEKNYNYGAQIFGGEGDTDVLNEKYFNIEVERLREALRSEK